MKTRLCAVLLALIPLLATASDMSIEVAADPAADFTRYKTYGWAESAPAVAAVTHERILAAVERELASKGLTRAETDPDLLLTYDASATEEIEPAKTVTGYGHGVAAFSGVGWYSQPEKRYRKGTLVLRMADARREKLVWQGSASDAIREQPEKNAKKVDSAVRKLLAKFAPERRP